MKIPTWLHWLLCKNHHVIWDRPFSVSSKSRLRKAHCGDCGRRLYEIGP